MDSAKQRSSIRSDKGGKHEHAGLKMSSEKEADLYRKFGVCPTCKTNVGFTSAKKGLITARDMDNNMYAVKVHEEDNHVNSSNRKLT
jgi:hypothetical protein